MPSTRVLYMSDNIWYLATVVEIQPDGTKVIQPDGSQFHKFGADPNRIIYLPENIRTVEEAVYHLQRCGSFEGDF